MSGQTVTIEKLVFGGAGLARTDQGVVFVTDVALGQSKGTREQWLGAYL